MSVHVNAEYAHKMTERERLRSILVTSSVTRLMNVSKDSLLWLVRLQASWLVGIKIARAHDASGIDNISVYIGQTIPEAGTVKGLIYKYGQHWRNVTVLWVTKFNIFKTYTLHSWIISVRLITTLTKLDSSVCSLIYQMRHNYLKAKSSAAEFSAAEASFATILWRKTIQFLLTQSLFSSIGLLCTL